VHFIVAACENMISGTGMRPGDVITASNGKTIEVSLHRFHMNSASKGSSFPLLVLQVNDTDSEGRLTLADALVYACNQGVDKVLFQRFFPLSITFFLLGFLSTCESYIFADC